MAQDPLYIKIYQKYRHLIQSGQMKAGQKLPTEAQICETFECGRQTVLRALQLLRSEKFINRRQGSGSFVAEQVDVLSGAHKNEQRKQIALICSDLTHSFGHELALGCEAAASKLGYDLLLCSSRFDVIAEKQHLMRFRDSQIAGILLVPTMPPVNLELVRSLVNHLDRRIPLVCLDYGFPQLDLPLVGIDNFQAARDAVSYLIELGHRRIAFIVNHINRIESVYTIKMRYEGYRQALKDYGIEYDPSLLQEAACDPVSPVQGQVDTSRYGYEPMHKLLAMDAPPTGVFLLWDELAQGAIAAIQNVGLRVPEDISVIGFNDDPIARMLGVPLTTIHQPGVDIGKNGVELLARIIENQTVEQHQIMLPTRLVSRRSCSVAPAYNRCRVGQAHI
jgi:DNA-binding LacI/PurR family transcriptional regulator